MKTLYPALLITCLGVSTPSLAASPLGNLTEHFAPQLQDQELSMLRGRYVGPKGNLFFGIQFVSSMLTAQEQIQTAAMNLTMSVSNNQPDLNISIDNQATSIDNPASSIDNQATNIATQATPTQEAPATPSAVPSQIQGSGLVQVLQLQGSSNSATNQTDISRTHLTSAGQSVGVGDYQHTGALGTVSYRIASDYVGFQFTSSDGAVRLEQSLRGSDFSRGLLQLNSVSGNDINTLNQAHIWFSH